MTCVPPSTTPAPEVAEAVGGRRRMPHTLAATLLEYQRVHEAAAAEKQHGFVSDDDMPPSPPALRAQATASAAGRGEVAAAAAQPAVAAATVAAAGLGVGCQQLVQTPLASAQRGQLLFAIMA